MKSSIVKNFGNAVRFTVGAIALAGIAILPVTHAANSRSMFEPIGVRSHQTNVLAGDTVSLDVDVEGPTPIQVYSDPPGAVDYTGEIDGTSDTIDVDTDPDTPAGPIAIYVTTGGNEVVSTTIDAE